MGCSANGRVTARCESTKRVRLHSEYREQIGFARRVRHVAVAVGAAFLVLFLQLARLQVLHGGEFHQKSVSNSIRLLRLPAPRGVITDVHGVPLVDNRPAFKVDFIPGESPDPAATLLRLAAYTELDVAKELRTIAGSNLPSFAQHRLRDDLTLAEVLPIEEHHMALPGVLVSAEPQRRIIHGPLAAHIIGTLGEIGARELHARGDLGYRLGDWVGKTGVEHLSETTLRGTDGGLQVEVYGDAPLSQMRMVTSEGRAAVDRDTRGRQVRTLERRSAVQGDTVVLALDLTLQQAAVAALDGRQGAVVVLEAGTGAIRAMVSLPTFDPNVFVRPARAQERVAMLTDPAHPMINRAMQAFAPGSTIKIVMTYAGLTGGARTPASDIYCPGYYTLGRRHHCWKRGGHGRISTLQALAYSCDTFFYKLGRDLGIDRVGAAFRDFGLGRPTGFDLPGEAGGLVPGKAWKQRQRHLEDRTWYEGETLNVSIGQGQMLATPLQQAAMLAPFVNGGYRVRPYIIARAETPDGRVLYRTTPRLRRVHGWDADAGEWVVEGLRDAVRARKPFYGTAWKAKLNHLDFIGKTGTAQVVRLVNANNRRKTEDTAFRLRDHAWFVGTVLDREPRLIIAVFAEHGGHASDTSVPVVGAFFNAIYPPVPPESEHQDLAKAHEPAAPFRMLN